MVYALHGIDHEDCVVLTWKALPSCSLVVQGVSTEPSRAQVVVLLCTTVGGTVTEVAASCQVGCHWMTTVTAAAGQDSGCATQLRASPQPAIDRASIKLWYAVFQVRCSLAQRQP